MPGLDFAQAGVYGGLPWGYDTSGGLVANRSYFDRFVAPKAMTITKMAFNVGSAASLDDPCDVGIYSGAGALLGSSGSTSGRLNSTGVKTIILATPVALVAGQVYYAALACGPIGGTAASVTMTAAANAIAFNMFGATCPNLEQTFNNSAFPLPATIAVSGPITNAPIMALLQ